MGHKKPTPKIGHDRVESLTGDDGAGAPGPAPEFARTGLAPRRAGSARKLRHPNQRDSGEAIAPACGNVEVSETLILAVARNATFVAELTAEVLKGTGLVEPSLSLPRGFLLELGAVLQIGYWELHGYRLHQEHGLPSYADASQNIASRCEKGAASFEGPAASGLSQAVMVFWLEHFAWDGHPLLGSDIVVGSADGDQFVSRLAEFLWDHRQQLSDLLPPEESHNAQ